MVAASGRHSEDRGEQSPDSRCAVMGPSALFDRKSTMCTLSSWRTQIIVFVNKISNQSKWSHEVCKRWKVGTRQNRGGHSIFKGNPGFPPSLLLPVSSVKAPEDSPLVGQHSVRWCTQLGWRQGKNTREEVKYKVVITTRVCVLSWLLSATPWTVAHQAPLSMGFLRQEYCSGLPCPPPGDLPDPGTEARSLTFSALAGRFFITNTAWHLTPNHYQRAFLQSPGLARSSACWPLTLTVSPEQTTTWLLWDGTWGGGDHFSSDPNSIRVSPHTAVD